MPLSQLPHSSDIRILADCDSFYASCELSRHPELKWQPLVICKEDGVVLTASYEAKQAWVHSAMATFQAKDILWDRAIYLEPDMSYYQSIWQQVRDILTPHSLEAEYFSIDEGFYRIEPINNWTLQDYENLTYSLQQELLEKINIPVSFWVARTRLQAKMLADLRKPLGVSVALDPPSFAKHFAWQEVGIIPFVGPTSVQKLTWIIDTVDQFLNSSLRQVRNLLGESAVKLYYELHGIEARSTRKWHLPQSIDRMHSYQPNVLQGKHEIRAAYLQEFNDLHDKLIYYWAQTWSLSITLRDTNFNNTTKTETFGWFTSDKSFLLQISKELLAKLYREHTSYRMIGIKFWKLSYGESPQSLFW